MKPFFCLFFPGPDPGGSSEAAAGARPCSPLLQRAAEFSDERRGEHARSSPQLLPLSVQIGNKQVAGWKGK